MSAIAARARAAYCIVTVLDHHPLVQPDAARTRVEVRRTATASGRWAASCSGPFSRASRQVSRRHLGLGDTGRETRYPLTVGQFLLYNCDPLSCRRTG
jgi:hypothetical protein